MGFSDPLENEEPFKVIRPAGTIWFAYWINFITSYLKALCKKLVNYIWIADKCMDSKSTVPELEIMTVA